MERWISGETITVRSWIGEHVGLEGLVTVVADDADHLALHFVPGTVMHRLVPPDGVTLPRVLSPREIAEGEFRVIEQRWTGGHLLHLTPTGAPWSVHVRWTEGWEFRGWYVNLQEPLRRGDRVVDLVDLFLDVVVTPDLSWQWKDEDELAEAVRVGRITAEDAMRIRTAGERAIADITARRWPFVPEIAAWRPDGGMGALGR